MTNNNLHFDQNKMSLLPIAKYLSSKGYRDIHWEVPLAILGTSEALRFQHPEYDITYDILLLSHPTQDTDWEDPFDISLAVVPVQGDAEFKCLFEDLLEDITPLQKWLDKMVAPKWLAMRKKGGDK